MPNDMLEAYRRADAPLPDKNRIWPLYGAGFENLGVNRQPIEVPMPDFGPDELLIRHDACGHCFSDIKVIRAGQDHPRIYRDMRQDPIVLGHELSLTVVGVGEDLVDQYKVGDRFIVQADIFVDGVGYAYGYEIQGGLSEYAVIDQRVLNGDHGNYLIPVQPETGYAEAALTEPWACVIAAYELKYRTMLRPKGTMWVIGTEKARNDYTISKGFDAAAHPAKLMLTNVPDAFERWLRSRAKELGIEVVDVPELPDPETVETDDSPVSPAEMVSASGRGVDDIILLGANPDIVERASPNLASYGIMAILDDAPMGRQINVDVGRIHYNRWLYIGTSSSDIARAYSDVPARATLKPGGAAWFVGAGGPMGRMHVQRAIQSISERPSTIVCTDISDERLDDLCSSFKPEAISKGIKFICLNPMDMEPYEKGMRRFKASGFDDIVILAPVPALIADAATYLAPEGVMNIFAGVPRGKYAQLDLSLTYLKQARVMGHSASTIENMRSMLFQAETGQLSPNRSVAAIGSLEAAWDGLQAVEQTAYPGKIVIYPHIKPLPLTGITELKNRLPSVHAKLRNGLEWTTEAEEELLRLMLK